VSSGQPAVFVEYAPTDNQGGHNQVTTYEVLSRDQVIVTVDDTGAQPPGGIIKSICTGLTGMFDGVTPTGCSPRKS
jgi:hypothetical protein